MPTRSRSLRRPGFGRSPWERVGRGIGTGAFLLVQSAAVVVWVAADVALTVVYQRHHPGCLYRSGGVARFHSRPGCSSVWRPPDPYPFTLLTLVLSVQAVIAGPLVLLSQFAQADRDVAVDEVGALELARQRDSTALLVRDVATLGQQAAAALTRADVRDAARAVLVSRGR